MWKYTAVLIFVNILKHDTRAPDLDLKSQLRQFLNGKCEFMTLFRNVREFPLQIYKHYTLVAFNNVKKNIIAAKLFTYSKNSHW